MKSFSVNTNSWHYKLNIRMTKTNDMLSHSNYAEKYVKSKDNFCSYWRMTLWSVFKISVAFSFIATVAFFLMYVIYLYGYALIFNTSEALVGTGVVIGLIATIVGFVALGATLDSRKRAKLKKILEEGETETSLAKAKYSTWKDGICIPVEFK